MFATTTPQNRRPSIALAVIPALVLATTAAEALVLQMFSLLPTIAAMLVGNGVIGAGVLLIRRPRPPQPEVTVPRSPEPDLGTEPTLEVVHPPRVWIDLVEAETSEVGPLTDHVFAMLESDGQTTGFDDPAFVRLDDLRWLLARYVLSGGRLRRLLTLPELISTLDCADGPSLDRSATALRSGAHTLVGAIRQTNVVVSEWLLTHRVAIPDPDVLDSNALFDRYRRVEIEADTVSSDPLYLLTCHIHDILETADSMGDLAHSAVETLEAALSRPLTILEDELAAATAFDAALVALTRAWRTSSADATHSAEAA